MKKKIINVVTLGCSKNIVDSEHLMAQLRRNNFEIKFDSNTTDAKIVVVNTCGFIGDAKEESVNTILGFANAKSAGEIDHLFVMGCLAERYKKELAADKKTVFRSTLFPASRPLVRGSNLEELITEMMYHIKLQ